MYQGCYYKSVTMRDAGLEFRISGAVWGGAAFVS